MPQALSSSYPVAANLVFIAVMAIAHVGTMVMLGWVVWRATRYRTELAEPYLAVTEPSAPSPPSPPAT